MKEKIIKLVAEKYHSTLRKHNFFPDFNQELKFYDSVSTACTDHLNWENFILGVETAYFGLSYNYRKIIKHNYFYKNYSFWWEEFYTRRLYKQYKQEAIDKFYENLQKIKILNAKGELKHVEDN